MTPNRLAILALAVLVMAWLAYWYNFGYLLNYNVSKSQEHWGLLGDFLGGVLNPILTFLTIVILIKSLSLQKDDIEKNKQFEKVRSFESHFFNMIDSQKVLFNNFKIVFDVNGVSVIKTSGTAVIACEDIIVHFKNNNKSYEDIKLVISDLDAEDSIYSMVRTFSVIAKLVGKKLSDSNGFSEAERKEYYEVLLSYTDFSLVRLVLICMRYTDTEQVTYLKQNKEFLEVLKTAGVGEYYKNM